MWQDDSRNGILKVKLGRLENFSIASSYTERQEKIIDKIKYFSLNVRILTSIASLGQ